MKASWIATAGMGWALLSPACAMEEMTSPLEELTLADGSEAEAKPAVGVETFNASATASDTPTKWRWYHGVKAAKLSAAVEDGYRIIDIEVEQASPLRFSATLVRNQGAYRKGWWWYYGLSGSELKAKLAENEARLTDLQVYRVNGSKRFAVVMIPNQGEDRAAWWYYTDRSFDALVDKTNDKEARLIDIDTYVVDGKRLFSGIMVKNTGSQRSAWWLYSNINAATISDKLDEHRARIVDLERRGNGRFTVLLQPRDGTAWWWYYGLSSKGLKKRYRQNGARIADIEVRQTSQGKRFDVLLVNNVNELTSDIRNTLDAGIEGGSFGFRIKRVGGKVRAGLNQKAIYYPASSIKVLHHLQAMRWVEAGTAFARLDTDLTVFGNTCPPSGSSTSEDLRSVLVDMMERSDNPSTNAVQDFFGLAALNDIAHDVVGMSDKTELHHYFGCNGPANSPANTAVLTDMTRLYEAYEEGELLEDPFTQLFEEFMLNDSNPSLANGGMFAAVIDEEAADLGLSSDQKADFLADLQFIYKGGSWNGGGRWRTTGGLVRIPARTFCRAFDVDAFVFAGFIDDAGSIDSGIGVNLAVREALRRPIRQALSTYQQPLDPVCTTPVP